ncbi:uncharacterized protein LOC128299305 [Anopheles moucheti]|uniref:uncharacterized protein LOC128299305 n=1 Tax=Anopheles moucheti TaxID=186751 RepID=UPI0022F0E53C|nr:uncharacterized protein LOC128299305 [Anopheles moucheti]
MGTKQNMPSDRRMLHDANARKEGKLKPEDSFAASTAKDLTCPPRPVVCSSIFPLFLHVEPEGFSHGGMNPLQILHSSDEKCKNDDEPRQFIWGKTYVNAGWVR